MAEVTLENYLKSDAGVKAARKKLAEAKALLNQLSSVSAPASAGKDVAKNLADRVNAAKKAVEKATTESSKVESSARSYFNTNKEKLQAKEDAKTAKKETESKATQERIIAELKARGQDTSGLEKTLANQKNKKETNATDTTDTTGQGGTGIQVDDFAGKLKTARTFLKGMTDSERLALAQQLKDANYVVPLTGTFTEDLALAYSSSISAAQGAWELNKEFPTVEEFLADRQKQVAAIKAAGGGDGSVSVLRAISDDTQASAIINRVFEDVLKREATPAEVKSLQKILNDAERKKPTRSVEGTTTGGLNRDQLIEDAIKTGTYNKKPVAILGKLSKELEAKKTDKRTINGESLAATAKANGITLSKAQLDAYTQEIQNGKDIDAIKTQIRNSASLGYPDAVKQLIAQGTDLETIYAPYRARMASVLEVSPDAIDLNDPTLRMAIGPEKEMTLYDFQRQLRKDNRWQYTNNARSEAADVTTTVLKNFGFMG